MVAVQSDSAFGFSDVEIETALRYQLLIKIVVLNDGGIGELPKDTRTAQHPHLRRTL